jgi:hypothetical protein
MLDSSTLGPRGQLALKQGLGVKRANIKRSWGKVYKTEVVKNCWFSLKASIRLDP